MKNHIMVMFGNSNAPSAGKDNLLRPYGHLLSLATALDILP